LLAEGADLASAGWHDALMFGAARWKDVVSGEHSYRFGVALRALVVVSDIKVSGALTLPVVAAKVELEGARASAQLMVRGYVGSDLAALLPTWQSFGVDSYAQYMGAVSSLQKAIMSDAANIQPELLATTVFSQKAADPSEAVGSVYGLMRSPTAPLSLMPWTSWTLMILTSRKP
jgi:hypothetical protein